jgi:hypothetical protein
MADCNNSYIRMIEARVSRAVRLAVGHGFDVDIKGSLLNIRDERSSGLLLFRSDHIVLQHISVDPNERRRRYGSAMLDLAIAIANQAALRLELIAEPPLRPIEEDLSQAELQACYRRRQFVAADSALMMRPPDGYVAA